MEKQMFEVLELKPTATVAEVRSAYRRLARRFHPDVAGPAYAAKFAEISRAHDVLIERLQAAGPQTLRPKTPTPDRAPFFAFETMSADARAPEAHNSGGDLIDDTITDILNDLDDAISSFGDVFGNSFRRP